MEPICRICVSSKWLVFKILMRPLLAGFERPLTVGVAKAYMEMVERAKLQTSWGARIIRFAIGQIIAGGVAWATRMPWQGLLV